MSNHRNPNTIRTYITMSNGEVDDDVWFWQESVDYVIASLMTTHEVIVVDIVPDSVIDNAPESKGFHDPDDFDAGGCSWITPQGSY